MTEATSCAEEWEGAVWCPSPEEKYGQLGQNDALLFAVAKTQALLNAINGESKFLFAGGEDIPWVRETCDEIVALLVRASELAPFK